MPLIMWYRIWQWKNQLPRVFSAALNSITWVSMGWISAVNLSGEKSPCLFTSRKKCPCRCMGCLIMVLLVRIMRTFCPSLIMIRSVSERVFPLMLHT